MTEFKISLNEFLKKIYFFSKNPFRKVDGSEIFMNSKFLKKLAESSLISGYKKVLPIERNWIINKLTNQLMKGSTFEFATYVCNSVLRIMQGFQFKLLNSVLDA